MTLYQPRYAVWTLALTIGLGVVCGLLPSAFKSSSSAGITLSTHALDFGTAGLFEAPQAEFVIANRQSTATRVSLAADCTCVELSASAFLLQPDEATTIAVTLRRTSAGVTKAGFREIQRELVINYSMEGGLQSEVVALSGQFFEPLIVNESACQFELRPFESTIQSIGVSAQVDVTHIEVQELPAWCHAAHIQWNEEFQAGHLVISVDPVADVLPVEGKVCIEIQYRQDQQDQTYVLCIPVTARVNVPISLDPPMLAVQAGEPKQQVVGVQVGILLREQVNFRIEEIESSTPAIVCEVNEDMQSFSVRYLGDDALPENSPGIELQVSLESYEGNSLKVPLNLPVIVF